MITRVGTCSLCGGDVYGNRGAYHSVNLPPPDACRQCGAVRQGTQRDDVIPMEPRRRHDVWYGHRHTYDGISW